MDLPLAVCLFLIDFNDFPLTGMFVAFAIFDVYAIYFLHDFYDSPLFVAVNREERIRKLQRKYNLLV